MLALLTGDSWNAPLIAGHFWYQELPELSQIALGVAKAWRG